MYNYYNTLNHNLKRGILKFFKPRIQIRFTDDFRLIEQPKRIYGVNKFTFYAIAYGLFVVFSKCKQGIADMLKKKPKSMQLSMFTYSEFNWC